MDDADFAEQLERAAGGDATAFAVLWRDTQPALLRYLDLLASGAADDVASETWIAVVKALAGFRGDRGAFRGWVFTIARRKAIDYLRAQSRRPEIPLAEPGEAERAAPDDTAGQAVENLSTEAALALIHRLPPEQAEIVMLRVVAGLDAKQVAALVGMSPGAVRVTAHRALRRLAKLLDETTPAVTP